MFILLGNFNVYSPEWNLHSGKRREAASLEPLIEGQGLVLNNKPGQATRPNQRSKTSIIDLNFATPEVGALDTCIIDEKLSTPSDYQVIVFDLESLYDTVGGIKTSQELTGWSVKNMSDEVKKEALVDCHQPATGRLQMGEGSSRDNMEDEVEWIEFPLMWIPDRHATHTKVTVQSKI